MMQAYDQYLQDCGESWSLAEWWEECEQKFLHFQFWSLTLKLELTVLTFVHSIRTANFTPYKAFMQSLLTWVFALDHINYARWLSVHLIDMLRLHQRNENIFPNVSKMDCLWFAKQKTHSPPLESIKLMNRTTVKEDGGLLTFFSLPIAFYKTKFKLFWNELGCIKILETTIIHLLLGAVGPTEDSAQLLR